jgi:hypothetical protein
MQFNYLMQIYQDPIFEYLQDWGYTIEMAKFLVCPSLNPSLESLCEYDVLYNSRVSK